MSVTWTHSALVGLARIWIATPRPHRQAVEHAWHRLADRLATDPQRAGEPFRDGLRAARVGRVAVFYEVDAAGDVLVRHAAAVQGESVM